MAEESWAAGFGQGYSYGNCFNGSDINSLPNGSSVLSSIADITNQVAQDIYADLSFSLGSVTTVAPNKLDFFLYHLNQDLSTYGDNQLPTPGSQAAKTPSTTLWVGTFVCPVGTQVLTGTIQGIILPPGSFRFVLQNNAGVTLNAGSNTIAYRTYNRQVK